MFICLKRIAAFLIREAKYRIIIINLLIVIFTGISLKDYFFAEEVDSREAVLERKTENISDKEGLDKAISEKAEEKEGIPMPKIQYQAEREGFKDPFRDSSMVKREKKKGQTEEPRPLPPNLVIQCVIWNSKLSQAIINNKVVKVGDVIDGAKILEIKKDEIKVFFYDKEYYLQSPSIDNLEAVKKGRRMGGTD